MPIAPVDVNGSIKETMTELATNKKPSSLKAPSKEEFKK